MFSSAFDNFCMNSSLGEDWRIRFRYLSIYSFKSLRSFKRCFFRPNKHPHLPHPPHPLDNWQSEYEIKNTPSIQSMLFRLFIQYRLCEGEDGVRMG